MTALRVLIELHEGRMAAPRLEQGQARFLTESGAGRHIVTPGARVPDFPLALDRIIAGLDRLEPGAIEPLYANLRRFYFDHADDPVRQAAFERHLAE